MSNDKDKGKLKLQFIDAIKWHTLDDIDKFKKSGENRENDPDYKKARYSFVFAYNQIPRIQSSASTEDLEKEFKKAIQERVEKDIDEFIKSGSKNRNNFEYQEAQKSLAFAGKRKLDEKVLQNLQQKLDQAWNLK